MVLGVHEEPLGLCVSSSLCLSVIMRESVRYQLAKKIKGVWASLKGAICEKFGESHKVCECR